MTERKDDRLWGGRFEREPNAQFDAFQRSFSFDRRLLPYEIAVDRAWAKALEPIGIFTATEVKRLAVHVQRRLAQTGHILGLVRVPDQAPAEAQDHRPVPIDQDPERLLAGGVAIAPETIQELAVGHGPEGPDGQQRIQCPPRGLRS